MGQEDFFLKLNAHFKKDLPFVCFSTSNGLKAYLQNSSEIHQVTNFEESGFVFVPFKANYPSVVFPSNKSEVIQYKGEVKINHSETEAINYKENQLEQSNHEALVIKAVEQINSTLLKKVICSRVIKIDARIDLLNTFQKIGITYPSAFSYCWHHPRVGTWLGATPEQFINLDRNILKTVSLAGTLPKAEFPIAKWTTKEFEEQKMVTDYIEQVLTPFSTDINIGEVETVSAGNLWHLKTKINCKVDPKDIRKIIEQLHPTSAVCGMPKKDALSFIENQERYERAYYAGFLGELNVKTKHQRSKRSNNQEHQVFSSIKTFSNLYVNLRCMQVFKDSINLYVGGGITKDSNPTKEYLETKAKSQTLLNVLQQKQME